MMPTRSGARWAASSACHRLSGCARGPAAEPDRYYAQVIGAGGAFGDLYGWSFSRGRFFSDQDVASRAAVAVLGAVVRDRLFGESANPIGKTVTIRNRVFTVVGVARTSDEEHLESVFVPYTTLQT